MKNCFFTIALLFLGLRSLASDNDSLILLNYQWKCLGQEKECSLALDSELVEYYRYERDHLAYRFDNTPYENTANYFGFMFSDYDREVIRDLASQLCSPGAGPLNKIYAALTFVQSLPYALDEESVGEEEYVRYPVETLADGEGDCEDKVSLLAALFKEMDVEFVLLELPDHLALGVHCDSIRTGQRIEYEGKSYYYVETTTPHWDIGQIPPTFQGKSVVVVPCSTMPVLIAKEMKFESQAALVTEKAQCSLRLRLQNMGPGKVNGLQLHLVMMQQTRRGMKAIMEETFPLEDLVEGGDRVDVVEFKSFVKNVNMIRVVLVAEDVPIQEYEMSLKSSEKRLLP